MSSTDSLKSLKSKKGNDVVFRYPTDKDFADMWAFACDIGSEDTFVALDVPPSEEDERIFFANVLKDVSQKESIYIMAYVNGVFAGNGRVVRGTGRHRHVGQMGISLMRPFRDEGIGTELIKSLIDEARVLGLRLLTLTCFETNAPACHIYEKLGFQKAGVTPGAIAFKGQYIGEVQYYLPLITD